ncbi:MAG TPA: adenosylcobinamide-GDP ribazoletransferase, partial [Candidatus Binataceae bacterium]
GAGSALLQRSAAGGVVANRPESRNLVIASGLTIAALLPILSRAILGAAVAALVITAVSRRFFRRWMGGVTGDLIGACGEIVEIAVLIAMAR